MAEIEKKYRVLDMPPFISVIDTVTEIKQGYLWTEDCEARIRQKGKKYFFTVKGDGNLSRDEWETEIPEWVFMAIWPKTLNKRVEKTRYSFPWGITLDLEVDEYHGKLAGLIILECEFPDEEAARNFKLPAWAKNAVEITADKAYKNAALATADAPPPQP